MNKPGYHSRSTQRNGQLKGNLFRGCFRSVVIRNGLLRFQTGAGSATISCNTFQRPAGPLGISYGIVREACQRQGTLDDCDQIDLTFVNNTTTPNLLKNRFHDERTGTITTENRFFHVANEVENGATHPLVYYTFDDIVPTVVAGPTVSVTEFGYPTTAMQAVDCGAEGYVQGLQFRPGVTSPPPQPARPAKARYWLAQNVPNPCTGSTAISYTTPSDAQAVRLVIRDFISGKVLYQYELASGEHTLQLRLDGFRPGPYHYALEIGGRAVARHNLLVQ